MFLANGELGFVKEEQYYQKNTKFKNAHFVYNRPIMVDTKENDYWKCHNCHHTHDYIDKLLHAFITTKCTRKGIQEENMSKQIIIIIIIVATHQLQTNAQLDNMILRIVGCHA